MHVEKFSYNSEDDLAANTYVIDDGTKAVIIDPSVDYDGVIKYLEKHHLEAAAILLTHAHFDHIMGVERLTERYKIGTYLHSNEEETLYNPDLNCSNWKEPLSIHPIVKCVKDGEILSFLENEEIRVIHTPFHTKGSVCYYFKNNKLLFSGDTLFKLSIGRDDLPTASPREREASLNKLKTLPKETKIYPGHGSNSTLEYELAFNYFLK